MADCSIATMLAAVSGCSQIPRYVRTIRVPMSLVAVRSSAATSTSGSMISRSDSRNSSAFDPNR